MEFTKETKSSSISRKIRKAIILICCIMLILSNIFISAYASPQNGAIKLAIPEPHPTDNVAYLIISATNSAKLFVISSQLPLNEIYCEANYNGSRWELKTGAIDNVSADIYVARYNAVDMSFENSYTITGSLTIKTTGIYTSSNFTNYFNYGIPVVPNTSIDMGSYVFASFDEVQNEINNNILSLETTLDNIENIINNYTDEDAEKLNTLIDDVEYLQTYLESMVELMGYMYTSVEQNTESVYTMYVAFNDYMLYIQPKLNSIDSKLTTINQALQNIKTYTNTINNNIKNAIMPDLQTIITKLDVIIRLLDEDSPTIPNQDTSNLDEYNSMEDAYMKDNTVELESIFNNESGINTGAITYINTLIQNFVFTIPELTSLIIMLLAIGIGVLILGRRV